MDWIKIAGIVLGATGFWKLVDAIIKWRSDKLLKTAEASNYFAQANNEVVQSFSHLAKELKEQMARQKDRIDELVEKVETEKRRNDDLEKHIGRLEKRNKELEAELKKLQDDKSDG